MESAHVLLHSSQKMLAALAHQRTRTSSRDNAWTNVQSTRFELLSPHARARTRIRSSSTAFASKSARLDTTAKATAFARPSVYLAPISTFPAATAYPESPTTPTSLIVRRNTRIPKNTAIIPSTPRTITSLDQLASLQRRPPSLPEEPASFISAFFSLFVSLDPYLFFLKFFTICSS